MTEEERDEQFYRDTQAIAFPKLDDHQLSLLEPIAWRRRLQRGEVVYKSGQRDVGLAVVLSGELQVHEQRDDDQLLLATAHEREFAGDVSMLQGTSIMATARVSSDEAEIMQVAGPELRRALAEIPAVSAPIVNASRRQWRPTRTGTDGKSQAIVNKQRRIRLLITPAR